MHKVFKISYVCKTFFLTGITDQCIKNHNNNKNKNLKDEEKSNPDRRCLSKK